uniref:Uncharacterized protein n=1 Tax=Arion vulgaris TaxID=1028688 RepID=A0A0B7B9Z3_9EUPU
MQKSGNEQDDRLAGMLHYQKESFRQEFQDCESQSLIRQSDGCRYWYRPKRMTYAVCKEID